MTSPRLPRDASRPGVVAIVGRPNVGKSALFNRILRRRLAIVHAESGVTRDRLVAEAAWDDRRFELVDTGGITTREHARNADRIAAETRRQADAAIEEAAAVILVVDSQAGLAPLDQEVAQLLRARGARVFVAVNKCDHPGHDAEAVLFEEFGFPVFPVSALHDRGIGDLMHAVAEQLPTAPAGEFKMPLRVAVVGRPNVGKSSYLNAVLRTPRLIVSEVPGTTRDSVDVPFAIGSGPTARRYVFTDTAGMRRSGKVDSAVERFSVFRAEQSIERADVVVLILDAAQGPTAHDKTIADLVAQHHKGCLIVVNKWDLMTVATQREYRDALARTLPFLDWVPVVFASSQSGYNIRQSILGIDRVAGHIQTQLPTPALNRVLSEAHERVAPPFVAGKRFKIYYATQTGIAPLRITLFVNAPKRLVPQYREYLIGALRKAFDIEGAPLVFQFKTREGHHDESGKSIHKHL
jgi:GTPase